jgi:serine-type D-Ala-D-Ala endopeptidase (penicillin-binding protein 7)
VVAAGVAQADAPALESPSVVALDLETGRELFAREADAPRPIASLTKLFAALVVRDRELALDQWTTISGDDASAAEHGAATFLRRGEVFRNADLLHLMLLVSDNRTPTALGRAVGLDPEELREAMSRRAAALGLVHTTFVDTTGILRNESTACELALTLRAALADPVLARVLRTRRITVVSRRETTRLDVKSTVRPLWHPGPKVLGGKTGTSEAAGACFVVAAVVENRAVVMAFLGGTTPGARFRDYARLTRWLTARADRPPRRRT